uniref:Uncharacterized protein n=1 Tax=Sus scrofa TaxID=9823 RepID=A0A8D1PK54_PIG
MAMVATQAVLSSSLASKILATGSLAKAGGAAVGSVLAGLPSAGLTLSFKAALTGAASSLGSLLGTLSTSSLIGSPPVTLMASSLGAKASVAVAGGGECPPGKTGSLLCPDPGTWGATGLVPTQACPRSPVHGGEKEWDGEMMSFHGNLWRQPQQEPQIYVEPPLHDFWVWL